MIGSMGGRGRIEHGTRAVLACSDGACQGAVCKAAEAEAAGRAPKIRRGALAPDAEFATLMQTVHAIKPVRLSSP